MTGKAYQAAVTALFVSAHAYWLASGIDPFGDDVARAMAHNAIQAAAHALNLEYHHRQVACPDHVASLAYRKLAKRWRASARNAFGGMHESEAHAFQVILDAQERGEDLAAEVHP